MAVKNAQNLFRGSVRDWLDDYMEGILLGSIKFSYDAESSVFKQIFTFLDGVLGSGAFVRYRGTTPVGALAPAYFEAVAIGTLKALPAVSHIEQERIRGAIIETVQSSEFRDYTGPGANSKEKLLNRIATIEDALLSLV